MLDKRKFKQIVIIGIYIFIFSLIGLSTYWVTRPKPTCFDGKKNQGEEGIDCGGPCVQCKKVIKAEDLVVENKKIIASGPQIYDAVVEVKNPNKQYGASQFQYSLSLLNAKGKILASRQSSSFVLPQEEKYLIETNFNITESIPVTLRVKINKYKWSKFLNTYEKPELLIYQKHLEKLDPSRGYVAVYGLLKNNSPFDFNTVTVKVILKDENNDILAANSTQMNTLTAGEERDFRLIWPHNFPGEISKIEIEPEADVYNSLNFTKRYLPHQKFQNYESGD